MHFTSDWFSNNVPVWEAHLAKLKNKPIKVLEVGSFEGRSAVWMLKNLLLHPKSELYCVDLWRNAAVYKRFMNNISEWKDKVHVLKGFSNVMLRSLNEQFDFVYIDANRHSQNVLEDAVLSFPLLKAGGIMIFDDYTNNKEHDKNCPKPGIDAFLDMYAGQVVVLFSKWQVVIRKRVNRLTRKPCYSEFWKEPKTVPEVYKDANRDY